MSASTEEEGGECWRIDGEEEEFERRQREFCPKMEDYRTRDYRKAHELFADGELGKRAKEVVGAEERQKMIESMLWIAWAYNQYPVDGPLRMFRMWEESMKEFQQQRLLALRRKSEENRKKSEENLKELQEENQLLKRKIQQLQSIRMKLQARRQEEEEKQNFNNVEGPEAKDLPAELQGTKKARVSGQSYSQSNGQSQSNEPQPSNNSPAEQPSVPDLMWSGGDRGSPQS